MFRWFVAALVPLEPPMASDDGLTAKGISMRWFSVVVLAWGALGCAPQECDEQQGTEAGNLVLDPHFDQGALCWYASQAGEENRGFSTSDDVPATGDAPSLMATNDAAGDALRTQLISAYMPLEDGKSYDVSFYARAEAERPVHVYVQQCCETTHKWLDHDETIGISWSRYSYTFDSDWTSDQAYFEIQMGQVAGTLWVDDVEVAEH